jgi:hypothetical protein
VVGTAGEGDLAELLVLMRAYCDLYEVAPADDALLALSRERCRAHGAVALTWQTAPDNRRAQALYDRVGARRSQWLDYDLPVA